MRRARDEHARQRIEDLRARLAALEATPVAPAARLPGPMSRVIEAVAAEWGVCVEALCGEIRAQRIVRPRQAAMLILARRGYSTPRIGRALRRDHTTVMHGIRVAEARAAQDPDFARLVGRVVERIEMERTPA